MARSWSFDRLSTVKIQPQSGTFRASCENNNCRLPSIEKKTQKAVLIISLQPSKARRNAHAAQRRCAGGGGDASRPASASAASKGLEAPTTLPGPPQCWASAPPEGRMADQVGHAARRAPLPAQMRGDLRVPPRRCRVQRIRGGVRARVRRVWALVPRGRRGARMLELVRCHGDSVGIPCLTVTLVRHTKCTRLDSSKGTTTEHELSSTAATGPHGQGSATTWQRRM